jgi:hypothetical protein
MDTALTYIELNKWESRAPILRAELNVAESVEYAVAERVKEGIDKGIERTKAELVGAQIRLHIAEAEGAIDILRTRLSQLHASVRFNWTTIRPLDTCAWDCWTMVLALTKRQSRNTRPQPN